MKRLLSLILTFIFVLGTPIAGQAATDLAGHWARPEMEAFMARGLIQGFPDGTVRPDHPITRAEFYALVNRAFGFTQIAPVTFADVRADAWYFTEIARAQAAGYILSGTEAFPNRNLTREEAAVIVFRILGLAPFETGAAQFNDMAAILSRPYVGAVALAGLMRGYPDGTFRPHATITRAEAVSVLNGAMTRAGIGLPLVTLQAQQAPQIQLESAIPAGTFGQDMTPGWPPAQPWNQGPVWGPTGPNQGQGGWNQWPWMPGPGWGPGAGWNQGPNWWDQGERLTIRVINEDNNALLRDANVEISALNQGVRRTISSGRTNSGGEFSFSLPQGLWNNDLVRINVSLSGFHTETVEIRVRDFQRTTTIWMQPISGGGGVTPGFVPVTNITGVPASATVGVPLTLTGTVIPSNATNQTITWNLQSIGTTFATISGNTLNTAAAGTVIVSATVINGASPTTAFVQNFSITVNAPNGGGAGPGVTVTSVTVAPNPVSVSAGTTQSFTALVAGTNNPPQQVTWSLSGNNSIGTIISATGVLTVAGNESAASIIVRATSVHTATIYGEATVTVVPPAPLILNPANITINDANLTANSTLSGTASGTISLDVSNLPAGVSATVNQGTGVITVTGVRPAAGGAPVTGSFDIIITRSAAAGNITLTVNVNLTPVPAPTGITVTTVPLGTTRVYRNETLQFNAAVSPSGSSQNVIWTVTDPSGVPVPGASIDAAGVLTVDSTVPGATLLRVRAESAVDSTIYGLSSNITVFVRITSIALNFTQKDVGDTIILSDAVLVTTPPLTDITFTHIIWGVTAPRGTGVTITPTATPGEFALTTTSVGTGPIVPGAPPLPQSGSFGIGVEIFNGAESLAHAATINIRVNSVGVSGVRISPTNHPTIRVGETVQLTAFVDPSTANQAVTWSSLNPGIATVNAAGLVTGVNASIPPGWADIVATSVENNSFFAVRRVIVAPEPVISGISVLPASPSVNVGSSLTFNANVFPTNTPATVNWTLTGQNSAGTTILPTGELIIAANETANWLTVTATSTVDPSQSGTAIVAVTAPAFTLAGTVLDAPAVAAFGEVGYRWFGVPIFQYQVFHVRGAGGVSADVDWNVPASWAPLGGWIGGAGRINGLVPNPNVAVNQLITFVSSHPSQPNITVNYIVTGRVTIEVQGAGTIVMSPPGASQATVTSATPLAQRRWWIDYGAEYNFTVTPSTGWTFNPAASNIPGLVNIGGNTWRIPNAGSIHYELVFVFD